MSVEKISVYIKYRDIEQTYSGNVNEVWIEVNRFFGEMVPAFDVAHKITLTVDLAKIIDDFKDVITIAPEGPELLMPREKLTDSDAIQLHLLASYIGYRLGKLTRETMTKEELQTKLGKTPKTTSARLSELAKEGTIIKTEEGKYKIATKTIRQLKEEVIPKTQTKVYPAAHEI